MFNLSGSEIVVILLLALVVLGPEKLPDALRRAGRTYAELKKMGNSFQSEMKSVLDEPMREMRETADLLRKSVDLADDDAAPSAPTTPRLTSARRDVAPTRAAGPGAGPADGSDPDQPSAADAPVQPATTPDGPGDRAGDGPDAVTAAGPETADEALINRTLSGDR